MSTLDVFETLYESLTRTIEVIDRLTVLVDAIGDRVIKLESDLDELRRDTADALVSGGTLG